MTEKEIINNIEVNNNDNLTNKKIILKLYV